jgi:hypothetical protein
MELVAYEVSFCVQLTAVSIGMMWFCRCQNVAFCSQRSPRPAALNYEAKVDLIFNLKDAK